MNENLITNSTAGISNITQNGWGITIIIFLSIFGILFILSKNFRQFIIGSIATIILGIVYKMSRWVGVSTEQGNYDPIKWFLYVVGFIAISIILGKIMEKFKITEKIGDKLKIIEKIEG